MTNKIRCGVKCAHADDVHDCAKCAPYVANLCEERCDGRCQERGLDSCVCPREPNGNIERAR